MKKQVIIRTDEDRQRFVRWINLFSLEKPVLLTLENYVKKHSRSQRGLYRIWLGEIASETGNDKDWLHKRFKEKFLTPEEVEVLGEIILVYTTKNLSTVHYSEYMTQVETFVADYGIMLSQPPSASGWR